MAWWAPTARVEHFALAYKLEPGRLRERVKEVIALMGLESKYDAMVGGLSRGMKQRLGIARAIVHDPPLLVLDEPASGLDPKARLELKELIRRLNREGKTVFITSHVLSDLEEICTSLAIMEKGKLLRVGKIDDVMSGAGRTKRVRIKLAASGFALGTWLAGRPGVSEVKEDGLEAEMAFPGTDAELAALVRDAVNAGAPVCGVEEKVETLEALFSTLSSDVTALWTNPEFLRNVRAQLRPAKVVATACICAALSIVIGYASSHQNYRQLATGPAGWGLQVLEITFWLQALMLAAGGGIAFPCAVPLIRHVPQCVVCGVS